MHSYHVGDIVKPSAEYRIQFPKPHIPRTSGIIVGKSKTPGCMKVKWRGVKTVETLATIFFTRTALPAEPE